MSTPSSVVPASRVASALGYLALVPFVVGAALICIVDADSRLGAGLALATYAAVVASFIGGIHWGLGFRQERPATSLFVWGVAPSIVAWIAVLVPARIGLVALALLLAICFLVDRKVYVREGVAAWLPLRRVLTIVAVLCCLAGAFGS